MNLKYPLYNLSDDEFESLVSLICTEILGTGVIVFSLGKDGGRDGKFTGMATQYPSSAEPWDGKFIIQAKHTIIPTASCSDSKFHTILKNECDSVRELKEDGKVDYYLLFTNRKLSGVQDPKIEDFIDEHTGVDNVIIGEETIQLWLQKYPEIAKALHLKDLFYPLEFYEKDLQDIVIAFSEVKFSNETIKEREADLNRISIDEKNELNRLSKTYFDEVFRKSFSAFESISRFLEDPQNYELKMKYENTIGDLQEEIIINRDDYYLFEDVLSHLYKLALDENNHKLHSNRGLLRVFLHYMYYNCDIGISQRPENVET
ncbi:ABC-three component system protein [uncultured Methanolobus sp.]|uniref:ABC-three component system protein n=1 Tax=uncultured Methanolobus sp. TaxID=218300 RepID=UPI002AABC733|nr:ABC-three component system protein [uncultured Methanolobus sp.]